MNMIGIIGAGSFGTALGKVLQENGNSVLFYVRTPRDIPNSTTSLEHLFSSCKLIFLAIPINGIPQLLIQMKNFINPYHHLIHCIKGLIHTEENTALTVSAFIKKELKHLNVGCLSGPNLANEIKNSQLTSAVIASSSKELTQLVKNVMYNKNFVVSESKDLIGVELGGIFKNIIALASGILNGIGEGDNAKSLLMTLGMKEMLQIAQMFTSNINFSTFYGIAGLGDLIATCSSNLSRNFTLGSRIARGEKLKDIVDIGTVEGVKTTSTIYNIAVQQKKEFPITFAVYKILSEEESPESFKKVLINLI